MGVHVVETRDVRPPEGSAQSTEVVRPMANSSLSRYCSASCRLHVAQRELDVSATGCCLVEAVGVQFHVLVQFDRSGLGARNERTHVDDGADALGFPRVPRARVRVGVVRTPGGVPRPLSGDTHRPHVCGQLETQAHRRGNGGASLQGSIVDAAVAGIAPGSAVGDPFVVALLRLRSLLVQLDLVGGDKSTFGQRARRELSEHVLRHRRLGQQLLVTA